MNSRHLLIALLVADVLIIGAIVLIFFGRTDESAEKAAAQARSTATPLITNTPSGEGALRLRYRVTGMHCDGCAEAICAEVSEVPGVTEVVCTFASGEARIALQDPVRRPEVEQAITKLGYQIEWLPEGADGSAVLPPASSPKIPSAGASAHAPAGAQREPAGVSPDAPAESEPSK